MIRLFLVATSLVLAIVAGAFWFAPGGAVAGECGKASFYGLAHQGEPMANGKPFNRHALTAASWGYPLGTRVIVRNVRNGRSVQVVITDRGPKKSLHRIIDLSEAAFAKLAPTSQGIIKQACIVRLK